MYDHIGLKVKDVETSVRFYSAALGGLGHVLASQDENGAGFGPQGAPALWLHRNPQAPGGAHLAFRAESEAAVKKFHQEGLKAGGRENGKPGLRADYSPTYYAAFLLDPDGNNVEAVWFKPQAR
jgi:catechol 2,3-dioxygenase-like lactoylglutathione lyase family enzyme